MVKDKYAVPTGATAQMIETGLIPINDNSEFMINAHCDTNDKIMRISQHVDRNQPACRSQNRQTVCGKADRLGVNFVSTASFLKISKRHFLPFTAFLVYFVVSLSEFPSERPRQANAAMLSPVETSDASSAAQYEGLMPVLGDPEVGSEADTRVPTHHLPEGCNQFQRYLSTSI